MHEGAFEVRGSTFEAGSAAARRTFTARWRSGAASNVEPRTSNARNIPFALESLHAKRLCSEHGARGHNDPVPNAGRSAIQTVARAGRSRRHPAMASASASVSSRGLGPQMAAWTLLYQTYTAIFKTMERAL